MPGTKSTRGLPPGFNLKEEGRMQKTKSTQSLSPALRLFANAGLLLESEGGSESRTSANDHYSPSRDFPFFLLRFSFFLLYWLLFAFRIEATKIAVNSRHSFVRLASRSSETIPESTSSSSQ